MLALLRDVACRTEPVSRSRYLRVGIILMLIKFSVDAVVYALAVGGWWNPVDYLNPIYALRMSGAPDAQELPPLYIVFLVTWGLAFAWIGVNLSSRRAVDAGGSAWWGLLFFVPLFNYLLIAVLLVVPTREGRVAAVPMQAAETVPAVPPNSAEHVFAAESSSDAVRTLAAVLTGVALAAVFLVLYLIVFHGTWNYGFVAFLSLPIAYGVGVGWSLNRRRQLSIGRNLKFAAASAGIASLTPLLLGLEGVICVAMALPILLCAVVIGVMLGRSLIAISRPGRAAPVCLVIAIPFSAWFDSALPKLPAREVASSLEIDAPPEIVWRHVVSFSELPEPDDWWFRTGLAYPLRARIDGAGVGAVRHCEFSTGAFVEPITVWDAPHRLGFDVIDQPVPMEEWSFYADVAPPHLETTFRSVRGEFRLIALEGGRTRLEGSTWYELDMAPAPYWRLWGDAVIHRIHDRVLRHVRALSEAESSGVR